jgi:alcohol dehydrogenase class IV
MALAANFAGKAINISKTTACHAISYPITSYFKVVHGQAVAITLPSLILYNSDVSKSDIFDMRGVEYVKKVMNELKALFNAKDYTEFKQIVENLMLDIGLEIKLHKLGIKTPDDIDLIIKKGFNPERMKNNPRKLTEKQLRTILDDIL